MKLVDILARELTEWPGQKDLAISQAIDGDLTYEYKIPASEDEEHWDHSGVLLTVASDFWSAVVTKKQWEKARAAYLLTQQPAQDPELSKIGKSMTKANKDGWIRHRGGKCPVDTGTLIDVRFRDRYIEHCIPACTYSEDGKLRAAVDWSHNGFNYDFDIMAWRPAVKTETKEEAPARYVAADCHADPVVDPLALRQQWESLGHEIKSNECSIKAHQESIVCLVKRQEAIKAELKAAGFLIYAESESVKVDASEDMSDPKNWREGDKLVLQDNWLGEGTKDMVLTVDKIKESYGELYFTFAELLNRFPHHNRAASGLKFHSRP